MDTPKVATTPPQETILVFIVIPIAAMEGAPMLAWGWDGKPALMFCFELFGTGQRVASLRRFGSWDRARQTDSTPGPHHHRVVVGAETTTMGQEFHSLKRGFER